MGSGRPDVTASAVGDLVQHVKHRGNTNAHGRVQPTMNMPNMYARNMSQQPQQPHQMGVQNAVSMMNADQRGKMVIEQQREQHRKQETERQLKERRDNEQRAQINYLNNLESLHLQNLASSNRVSRLSGGGNSMSTISGANSNPSLQENIPPASRSTNTQQTSDPSKVQVPDHHRTASASLTKKSLGVQEASTLDGRNSPSPAESAANHLSVPARETSQTSLLQNTNDLANINSSSSHSEKTTSQNSASRSAIGNLDTSSSTVLQENQQDSIDTNLPLPTTKSSQFDTISPKEQDEDENMAPFLPENIDPLLRGEPFQLALPDEKKRKTDSDNQSGPNKKATQSLHSSQTPSSMTSNPSTRTSPHAKLIPNSAMHMVSFLFSDP